MDRAWTSLGVVRDAHRALGRLARADIGRRALPSGAAPSQLHRALALLATISLFIGTRAAWTGRADPVADGHGGHLGRLPGDPWSWRRSRSWSAPSAPWSWSMCSSWHRGGPGRRRPDPPAQADRRGDARRAGGPITLARRRRDLRRGLATALRPAAPAGHLDDGRRGRLHVRLSAAGGPADGPGALVFSFPAAASMVTTAMLCSSGRSLLWRLLPIDWRPGATIVMLGLPVHAPLRAAGVPGDHRHGLADPGHRPLADIGRAGRLRRSDLLRAVCLGAACATQQLAWFVAPFLLVGLLRCAAASCRRDGPWHGRASSPASARPRSCAINLPFIVGDAPAWAAGIALVLTQHAIPHGQGLIDVSFYLTDGSAALDFYSYATLLLAIGLLGISGCSIRRLGPALTVIPWIVFYLSVRSQDGYFLLMTPLWLAAAGDGAAVRVRPRLAAAAPLPRPIGARMAAPPSDGCAGRGPRRPGRPHARAIAPVRVRRGRERRAARPDHRGHAAPTGRTRQGSGRSRSTP